MSPKEFELSQSVLQFLIVHQEHFTLDISPPLDDSPRSPEPRALANHVRPMPRRRTTTEDPGLINDNGAPMSPITEDPLDRPNPRNHIKRSLTLPTRRKGAAGDDPPRVLRKRRLPRDKDA
ncbi:hypothetical protein C0992_009110 [Termitomyces sp. T32_za158]|nr:hypothetical protein C0992_009110 [Termitomyces sp. T32_za158]